VSTEDFISRSSSNRGLPFYTVKLGLARMTSPCQKGDGQTLVSFAPGDLGGGNIIKIEFCKEEGQDVVLLKDERNKQQYGVYL
jgi:hypothetical protein